MGRFPESLTELESATVFWTAKYYYATDENRAELETTGTALGRKLLAANLPGEALRAFSAAGMGGGRPAAYLAERCADLDPASKSKLWPDIPVLIVHDFHDSPKSGLDKVVDEQNRTVQSTGVDAATSFRGSATGSIALGASTQSGKCWYGVSTRLPVTETAFALRVYVKEQAPVDSAVLLGYWFEAAKKSADSLDTVSETQADGWKCFDIRRNFYRERMDVANQQGYSIADGFVNMISISFPPGPANRFWMGRVELYFPEAAPPAAPAKAGTQ